MLLEASAPFLKAGQMTLDVVGDGPLMPELRAFIGRERLGCAVTLHGWVKHQQVQDLMCQTHMLGLPSVREFGGGVVLEAMALGVVPLVVDYAGPGELVDKEIGFKVPMGPRREIVAGFHDTLSELVDHPELLSRLSRACRIRIAQKYTWAAKSSQILEVYKWVARRDTDKPVFFERAQA